MLVARIASVFLVAFTLGAPWLAEGVLVLNRDDNAAVMYDLATGKAAWRAWVGTNPQELAVV